MFHKTLVMLGLFSALLCPELGSVLAAENSVNPSSLPKKNSHFFYEITAPEPQFFSIYNVDYVIKTKDYIFAPNLDNNLSYLYSRFFEKKNLADVPAFVRFDSAFLKNKVELIEWLTDDMFSFDETHKQFFIFKKTEENYDLLGIFAIEKLTEGEKTGAALSLFIDHVQQGKGLAAGLAANCIAWFKEEYPSVEFIENTVREDNLASRALCEKMGMKLTASGHGLYVVLSNDENSSSPVSFEERPNLVYRLEMDR